MSYLEQQMNLLKFDKRLLEINLKSGAITKAEFEQHIKTLKDEADRSERMTLEGDNDDFGPSMSGHRSVAPAPAKPTTNNDPFGSGY